MKSNKRQTEILKGRAYKKPCKSAQTEWLKSLTLVFIQIYHQKTGPKYGTLLCKSFARVTRIATVDIEALYVFFLALKNEKISTASQLFREIVILKSVVKNLKTHISPISVCASHYDTMVRGLRPRRTTRIDEQMFSCHRLP